MFIEELGQVLHEVVLGAEMLKCQKQTYFIIQLKLRGKMDIKNAQSFN